MMVSLVVTVSRGASPDCTSADIGWIGHWNVVVSSPCVVLHTLMLLLNVIRAHIVAHRIRLIGAHGLCVNTLGIGVAVR